LWAVAVAGFKEGWKCKRFTERGERFCFGPPRVSPVGGSSPGLVIVNHNLHPARPGSSWDRPSNFDGIAISSSYFLARHPVHILMLIFMLTLPLVSLSLSISDHLAAKRSVSDVLTVKSNARTTSTVGWIPRKSSIVATSKVLQKSPIITLHHLHAYGEAVTVMTWDSYLALRLRLRDRDEGENEDEDEDEDEDEEGEQDQLEDDPEPSFSEFSEEEASFLVTEVLKLIFSGTEEVDRGLPGMGKVMR
jgi:hypothetical protein